LSRKENRKGTMREREVKAMLRRVEDAFIKSATAEGHLWIIDPDKYAELIIKHDLLFRKIIIKNQYATNKYNGLLQFFHNTYRYGIREEDIKTAKGELR